MGNEIKFGLLEIGTMEQLRDYYTIADVFNDIRWKSPESFWIGDVEEKQAYTIPQFLEKYNKEYECFVNVMK